MKKYIKPVAEVVELTVRESLSDVPAGVNKLTLKKVAAGAITPYNVNVSDYVNA